MVDDKIFPLRARRFRFADSTWKERMHQQRAECKANEKTEKRRNRLVYQQEEALVQRVGEGRSAPVQSA